MTLARDTHWWGALTPPEAEGPPLTWVGVGGYGMLCLKICFVSIARDVCHSDPFPGWGSPTLTFLWLERNHSCEHWNVDDQLQCSHSLCYLTQVWWRGAHVPIHPLALKDNYLSLIPGCYPPCLMCASKHELLSMYPWKAYVAAPDVLKPRLEASLLSEIVAHSDGRLCEHYVLPGKCSELLASHSKFRTFFLHCWEREVLERVEEYGIFLHPLCTRKINNRDKIWLDVFHDSKGTNSEVLYSV
jgi:hypothetical protein